MELETDFLGHRALVQNGRLADSDAMQYAGVIEEHLTVRRAVGLFDLCHMGEFDLEGPGALAVLSKLTTNDPAALQEGDIQYTMLTKPDGGIIDDILVYRTATGFFLVVNAANTAKDFAWIKEHLTPDATLQDRSSELALLAVQGPKSLPVVEKVLGFSLADLGSYTFLDTTYKDLPLRISRTGYTGEDGFELYLPNAGAEPPWEDLMAAGGLRYRPNDWVLGIRRAWRCACPHGMISMKQPLL